MSFIRADRKQVNKEMTEKRLQHFSRLLLYQGKEIERQNMLWNMLGSFIYAAASMVLSFLVMRIAGAEASGVFAVGFSTVGQQMFTLAYYGLRPFQVTDGKAGSGGYSFGEYRKHRRITTAAAFFAAAGFSSWMFFSGAYGMAKAAAVFLLAVYKIIDGWADVYESEFQRQGSLYLTGKSNTFRTILSVAVFLSALFWGKSLLLACGAAVLAQVLGFFLFDSGVIRELSGVDWRVRQGEVRRLFSQGGLLFVSVFLDFYIFSAAKYAIDSRLNDAASGYFNLLFMPTSVIYLVANFVIRPFLTKMTACWEGGERREYLGLLKKLGLIIAVLTVLAVAGAWFIGPFVLSFMEMLLGRAYRGTLSVYRGSFTGIVLGGGIYAFANLCYYSLVVMRRQKRIFVVYLLTAGIAFWAAPALVSRFAIPGAAAVYGLLMGVELLGFGGCVVRELQNGGNDGRRKTGDDR